MASNDDIGFWEEFIDIYHENPCLWNTNCADFKDESKRNIAYGLLLEKVWEIDQNADEDTVKNKISSFRSNFSKQYSRVQRLKVKGRNVPSWNFYKKLSFLIPFEEESITGVFDTEKTEKDSKNTPPKPTIKPFNVTKSNDKNGKQVLTLSTETLKPTGLTENLSALDDNLSDLAIGKKRKLTNEDTENDEEDDCSTFAAYVKTKMRSFDPMQKCIAQKLISDVIFMAETKTLELSSTISNLSDK